MAGALASKLATADILGRTQILRHAYTKTGRRFPISAAGTQVRFDEGDDAAAAGFAFDVGGEDSAEYIRRLTPVTKQIYDGLTAQYRRDAFTLAGASDLRLVKDLQEQLAEIAAKGGTPGDFRASADQLTTAQGVEKLNAFTLDTAFNTAMQKAYSSGRLTQMREPHMIAAMPAWQYWTVGDLRVRPEHAVLDGFIARAIDPVWIKIYPPSGFNCRCSVVPLPEDEAEKIDPQWSEGGIERLPILARELVPQSGFHSLIHA